jgi:TonB family protein
MIAVLLLVAALGAGQVPAPDRSADLAAVRSLYASAAYEDALARLASVSASGEAADQVDTYRALCLLALGRTADAERTLEDIVLRNPRFTLDESDVSPRLVAMFRAVKGRALPTAARALYTNARTNFDLKQYDAAATQLRDLLLLIGTGDAADAANLADLKVLAEGFLRLAESMRGPQPAAATSADTAPAAESGGGPVYSILHRDVVAPVEISRQVPNWDPPRGFPQGLYQGLVEVVINEDGRVESAVIRKSVSEAYDALLLAATTNWRFQPATRNGEPVRYRKLFEVIVHSR